MSSQYRLFSGNSMFSKYKIFLVFQIQGVKDLVFQSFRVEILGFSIEIPGFSFEVPRISKTCDNRIPHHSLRNYSFFKKQYVRSIRK